MAIRPRFGGGPKFGVSIKAHPNRLFAAGIATAVAAGPPVAESHPEKQAVEVVEQPPTSVQVTDSPLPE